MNHSDVIDRWPSISDFADDLSVAYGTAKAMRRRASIPAEHWLRLVEKADGRGIEGVTLEVLAAAVARDPESSAEAARIEAAE